MIHVEEERNRIDRILFLYDKLTVGEVVHKSEVSVQFHVHERTIRRDIQDIKYYIARFRMNKEVIYDAKAGGYRLVTTETASFSRSG